MCLFPVSNCTKVCVIYKTVRLARYLGLTPTPAPLSRINSAGIRKAFNFFSFLLLKTWLSQSQIFDFLLESVEHTLLNISHFLVITPFFCLHLEEQNCKEDLVEKNTQEASSLPSLLNHSVLRLLATTYHNNLRTVTHQQSCRTALCRTWIDIGTNLHKNRNMAVLASCLPCRFPYINVMTACL